MKKKKAVKKKRVRKSSVVKCQKCGNTDIARMVVTQDIPISYNHLRFDKDAKKLIIDAILNDLVWDCATTPRIWCADCGNEEILLPKGVEIDWE